MVESLKPLRRHLHFTTFPPLPLVAGCIQQDKAERPTDPPPQPAESKPPSPEIGFIPETVRQAPSPAPIPLVRRSEPAEDSLPAFQIVFDPPSTAPVPARRALLLPARSNAPIPCGSNGRIIVSLPYASCYNFRD